VGYRGYGYGSPEMHASRDESDAFPLLKWRGYGATRVKSSGSTTCFFIHKNLPLWFGLINTR